MADQNEVKAADKPEAVSAPAEAASKAVSVQSASEEAPQSKRAARKPVASRRQKNVRQAKPVSRPAAKTQRKVARAAKGAEIMNKQTRNGMEANLFAADQIQNVFGDVNERAKAAAERSAKVVEEMADLTRGNVEALVASSKVAARAVETLSQDVAEYGRRSFEEASAAMKNFAEIKSPTDFFRLQGEYARAAFDNAVAESARLSETMVKLAGDVAEPITNRYTVAAERVKTFAA